MKRLYVLSITVPGGEWKVHGKSFSRSEPDLFDVPTARVIRELMRRKEEDTVFPVKCALRAVAMMDIPVNDENAAEAVILLEIPSCHGDVVDEAKTHSTIGLRVMSRWPAKNEGLTIAFLQNPFDGSECSTRCQPCDFKRLRGYWSVGIQQPSSLVGCFLQIAEVSRGMNKTQFLECGQSGRQRMQVTLQGMQRTVEDLETLGTFRVCRPCVVLKIAWVCNHGNRHDVRFSVRV